MIKGNQSNPHVSLSKDRHSSICAMGLTSIQVALPDSVKYLAHVHEAINAYLTPLTRCAMAV